MQSNYDDLCWRLLVVQLKLKEKLLVILSDNSNQLCDKFQHLLSYVWNTRLDNVMTNHVDLSAVHTLIDANTIFALFPHFYHLAQLAQYNSFQRN